MYNIKFILEICIVGIRVIKVKDMKKLKINIFRAIIICCLLALFVTIFSFSNQTSEVSGGLSRKITYEITKNIKHIQQLDEPEKENILSKIETFIRKLAHYTLYALVGFLMMLLMVTYNLKQIKRSGISFGVGLIYAISDEVHQSFVPGRGPMVQDVLLDSFGVISGIVLCMLIIAIISHIMKKLNKCKKIVEKSH